MSAEMGEYATAFEKREQNAHDRADTIKRRLTLEMGNTIASYRGSPELVLQALVDDAMFQVEVLLSELHNV